MAFVILTSGVILESARQKAEEEKQRLEETHREELRKVELEVQSLISQRNEEHMQMSRDLARQMVEIEQRRKELEQREAQNDLEKKKLEDDKKKIYSRKEVLQRANELQRTQEENQRKLIEKHEILTDFGNSRSPISIKRMGELVSGPWTETCKKKFKPDEWEIKYTEMFSLWQDYLRDPNWYPFKVVQVGEKHERVVDESDQKLRELREEMGKEVCASVIEALKELNEYNASGRYPIPEVWNNKEKILA